MAAHCWDDVTTWHSFGGVQSIPENVVVVPAVTGHGNHGAKSYADRVEDLSCCTDPNLQGAIVQGIGLDGLDLYSASQGSKTLGVNRAMLSLAKRVSGTIPHWSSSLCTYCF